MTDTVGRIVFGPSSSAYAYPVARQAVPAAALGSPSRLEAAIGEAKAWEEFDREQRERPEREKAALRAEADRLGYMLVEKDRFRICRDQGSISMLALESASIDIETQVTRALAENIGRKLLEAGWLRKSRRYGKEVMFLELGLQVILPGSASGEPQSWLRQSELWPCPWAYFMSIMIRTSTLPQACAAQSALAMPRPILPSANFRVRPCLPRSYSTTARNDRPSALQRCARSSSTGAISAS